VDSSGNINGVGPGTSPLSSSASAFFLKPVTLLGAASDLAQHFSYWKLHTLVVKYVPLIRPVQTAIATPVYPGIGVIAFSDDPTRIQSTPTAGSLIQDSRVGCQFAFDKPFTLTYTPVGVAGKWLSTSLSSGSVDPGVMRQCSAGMLTYATTTASSFVSGAVGRIMFQYDISFLGSACNSLPTLSLTESKTEAKQEALAKLPGVGEEKKELIPVALTRFSRADVAAVVAILEQLESKTESKPGS
jgi:hypothetical protein